MVKHAVVLISGKQGSGKTTLSSNLVFRLSAEGYPVYTTRFAKVLYMMHDAVRDIGRKYGIDFPQKNGPLLQYLGTEVVRNNYGEDSWVNCVRKELSDLPERRIVIIDDARFENEAKAFDNRNLYDVFKVRLEASKDARKARADAWRDNDVHPSEVGLDNYNDWDLVVNTGAVGKDATLDMVLRYLPFYKHEA